MLKANMMLVVWTPKSGSPELSSNTEPTAAIAVTQQIPKNRPLFGVKYTTKPPYPTGFTA
ncbi:MAG: hypothetical protein F6K62_14750 [Sphaerospermopsis sp. SIO1G2]|nr:hypothetical protein [Sphaerospermopsis sp. SIO1G2]